jgi:ABC-2 type transport system permease protein
VSGVYYEVSVLPPWLQVFSVISPATYILAGVRGALIEGQGVAELTPMLFILAIFALVLVPGSIAVFGLAERWAKKAGRLKRQG